MAESASLNVKSVLDRFESSEQTLQRLSEKLRSLTLAEEASSQSAASISSAAGAINGAADQLQTVAQAAESAQNELKAAVQAAADFLGATDLSELNKSIQAVSQAVRHDLPSELRDRVGDSETTITDRLSAIEDRLAELEKGRKAEAELREQLDLVRSGLSPRMIRKLGLSG